MRYWGSVICSIRSRKKEINRISVNWINKNEKNPRVRNAHILGIEWEVQKTSSTRLRARTHWSWTHWTFHSLFSFLCTLNWDFYFSELSKSVSGYAMFVSFFFVLWNFSPLGQFTPIYMSECVLFCQLVGLERLGLFVTKSLYLVIILSFRVW